MIIPERLQKGEHCLYDEWYKYTEKQDIFVYKRKQEKLYHMAERQRKGNSVTLRVIALFPDLTDARDFADKHYLQK